MHSSSRNDADPVKPADYSTLERAFDILDAFRGSDRSVSLKELAARTGMPKPTVHRVCTRLVQLGMLTRVDNGFQLGVALFSLGCRVPYVRTLRDVVHPYLGDLHDVSRATVHLGVLQGRRVICIEKVSSGGDARVPSRVGGGMPIHSSAMGKAILAFSPLDLVGETFHSGLRRSTPYTVVDRQKFLDELGEIAARGYAFDHEEVRVGLNCVAAPLLGRDGHALAGISVTGQTGRFDPERLSVALLTTTRAISREIQDRAVDLLPVQ